MQPSVQTIVEPAATAAIAIEGLWWLMFWTMTVIFIVVMTVLAVALRRRQRDQSPQSAASARPTVPVAIATALTVVTLFGLLIASVWTSRVIAETRPTNPVSIQITGHQWWWEIEYEAGVPSQRMLTANEIHIPVGRPVVFKVTSRDVIHSFWAPNLHGKRDLIPGYTTAIWTQATRPGVFRAQCAEFCGLQHAHMALEVIAEPEDAFSRWLEGRRASAPAPGTDIAKQGQAVFMSARCAGCHTIRGTDANGQIAPDLTHMASRGSLGAGTLPNTPEHLEAWLRDPQASKPGNQMPPNPLSPSDMHALVAYLGTLR
jgi:cytochrome c oxidase subunit II